MKRHRPKTPAARPVCALAVSAVLPVAVAPDTAKAEIGFNLRDPFRQHQRTAPASTAHLRQAVREILLAQPIEPADRITWSTAWHSSYEAQTWACGDPLAGG